MIKQKDIKTESDGIQTITASVGDTVTFQLDEPIDGAGLTWDIIELLLSYNRIFSLAEESFTLNSDGKGGVRTFKLKIKKVGEEVITFARGDVTKFDDAQDDYASNKQN